jgi:hypothetical protein
MKTRTAAFNTPPFLRLQRHLDEGNCQIRMNECVWMDGHQELTSIEQE